MLFQQLTVLDQGKPKTDQCLFSGEHRWAAISAFGHLEEVGGSARGLPAGAGGGPRPLC